MATVTGLTAARMIAIEAASIVDGEVVGDNLILTKFDGTDIDAGSVRGATGPMGTGPGLIPGEVRMWPCPALPAEDPYGLWVWANGGVYVIDDHPIAADHLGTTWNLFAGASSPGAGNFRVPDLRGLTPAGMDQMPAGTAANRVVRAEADDLAGITGEETHQLTIPELAAHDHAFSYQNLTLDVGATEFIFFPRDSPGTRDDLIENTGDDEPHENMQPTVFIPFIVFLDVV